jgi:hypothetical protein
MPWANNPSLPRSHKFPGTAPGVEVNRIEPANAFSGGRAFSGIFLKTRPEAQMREVIRAFSSESLPRT